MLSVDSCEGSGRGIGSGGGAISAEDGIGDSICWVGEEDTGTSVGVVAGAVSRAAATGLSSKTSGGVLTLLDAVGLVTVTPDCDGTAGLWRVSVDCGALLVPRDLSDALDAWLLLAGCSVGTRGDTDELLS